MIFDLYIYILFIDIEIFKNVLHVLEVLYNLHELLKEFLEIENSLYFLTIVVI